MSKKLRAKKGGKKGESQIETLINSDKEGVLGGGSPFPSGRAGVGLLNLAIGCDHAGYQLKEQLKEFLKEKGHVLKDFGTYSEDSTDYPDYAHPLAQSVWKKEVDFGILMCGSGNGINMTANKHQGVRAALCWKEELAKFARQHNNANVISLPARFINFEEAKKIVSAFLNTEFEGGRHERRVDKIDC